MRVISYPISPQDEGKDIQTFLRQGQGFSAHAVAKLKHYPDGILLNGVHARTIDRLCAGDTLSVTFREEEQKGGVGHVLRSNLPVPICWEDEDLIIYNKPPFMPVHPSCGHSHDTLCNVFAAHCDRLGQDLTFRPVNRLDRDTSGAVIVAKSRYSAARLAASCEKRYLAVVTGKPDPPSGRVDAPIKREQEIEMRRIVHPDGRPAVTFYETLDSRGGYSLAAFRLLTGRTHQIRVHMAWLGNALAGDSMYGESSPLIGRQALHCAQVLFAHPVTGTPCSCLCPLPEDFKNLLDALGLSLPSAWGGENL